MTGEFFAMILLMGSILFFCVGSRLLAAEPAPTSSARASQQAWAPPSGQNPPAEPDLEAQVASGMYIREYRVKGVHMLTNLEVEEAVYPFLGPGRTKDDVEKAREALEKAYQAKGYQTASVQIPPQQVKRGVVMLQAVEGVVGRLRVKGSRYYSPEQIKGEAPSLAEGKVPNFNDVSHDIVALNQLADRRVTPVLRAGEAPGTVDIDLNVKDSLPLHGSVELNNRYSVNTTELRLNGSVSYDNLWQMGHGVGFSFQLAPERLQDAEVFSGYYLVRFPNLSWLSLMAEGTKQDSDVSSLGGTDVAGRGEIAGLRAIINLPTGKDFYESISLGLDYKHFDQDLTVAGVDTPTPTTYYPLSASYNANWTNKGAQTELNASVNLNLRGLGSSLAELNNSRFSSNGNFIYLRGDISHVHDLPGGLQVYGKVQGQVSDQALINSEQISGGGLSTVRGYLESAVLGDNGIFTTMELRSPSLSPLLRNKVDEWRFYVFGDWGMVSVIDALPGQDENFSLASFGWGTRLRLFGRLNGSLDMGVPLISQGTTKPYNPFFTFRLWAEF
jgi:hemolysin activation/secretion protein